EGSDTTCNPCSGSSSSFRSEPDPAVTICHAVRQDSTNQRFKLSYSITSSAMARSESGMVRPSAFAALRWIDHQSELSGATTAPTRPAWTSLPWMCRRLARRREHSAACGLWRWESYKPDRAGQGVREE